MGSRTTKRPKKNRDGGFDLPPGYMAKGYGRRRTLHLVENL